MKQRVIHIHIEDEDAFFNRAKSAAKRAKTGEPLKDVEHLSFASYEQFTSAFSEKRYDLLRRLKSLGPSSIRALSKDLARDYKSVHGDVQKLLELGLIEKRDDGLIEAPYDTIVSEINLKAA
jgi:predicted transcriptional regulator